VRAELFESAGRPGYARPRLVPPEVRPAILGHTEFTTFRQKVTERFYAWRKDDTKHLVAFGKDAHPKALIERIAEDLLAAFRETRLLDAYDVYQRLMDYWAETMQDDAYLIAADGWGAHTYRVIEEVKGGKKKGERKDKGWACDLAPKPLIVARFFAKEQTALETLESELESVSASLDELAEEYGGEEGILKDVSTQADAQAAYTQALVALWNDDDKVACDKYNALMNEAEEHTSHLRALTDHHHISPLKNNKGKLTLKVVKERLSATDDRTERATLHKYLEEDKQQKAKSKEGAELVATIEGQYRERLKTDPIPEDLADLHPTVRYLQLLDEQSTLKAKVKEADAALDTLAYEKYPTLTECTTSFATSSNATHRCSRICPHGLSESWFRRTWRARCRTCRRPRGATRVAAEGADPHGASLVLRPLCQPSRGEPGR
jgi:type I restriction enzyme M protein